MTTLSQSEIRAIASLLKSPDETTLRLLEEQLKNFDTKLLKNINDEIPLDDIPLRKEFSKLLKKIKREQLKKDFTKWSRNYSDNLEHGVFLIALFDNPLVDQDFYSNELNKWAESLDKNLNKIKLKNEPTSIINEVNHYLFMDLGFKGNKESYYAPENSYIDKVIESKLGNPILLSTIYLLVTQRLNLPFKGVNMPAHFLVKFSENHGDIYIDPFNQGEIITKAICQERIKALKLPWQEDYLTSPTNKQIIIRMIQNLINIYQNEEQFDLKEYLEEYVKILKSQTS